MSFKIINVLQGDTVYYNRETSEYIYHEKHPVTGVYMVHLTDSAGEIKSNHNSVIEAIQQSKNNLLTEGI